MLEFRGYPAGAAPNALQSATNTIVAGCTGGIRVSWVYATTGDSATNVLIEQSIDGGSYTTLTTVSSPTTSYDVGVIAASNYQFRITPNNSFGNGPSSTTSLVASPGTPNTITSVTAVNNYPNGFNLTFNHPGTGPTVYAYHLIVLDMTIDEGVYVEYAPISPSPYNWTAALLPSVLISGHTYRFQATPCGSSGLSDTSTFSADTSYGPQSAPGLVSNVTAELIGGNVELNWSYGGSDYTHFEIDRRIVGESLYSLYDTSVVKYYIDDDILSGWTYQYRVRAVNEAGAGGNVTSNEVFIP
jgi:hypothetical protein